MSDTHTPSKINPKSEVSNPKQTQNSKSPSSIPAQAGQAIHPRPSGAGYPSSAPSSYFQTEQSMIEYWKKNRIFERSVEERPADRPWTFLDGPPFVTGLPHYGHIIGSIVKDVFPRFKTMQGYRVRRVWGWDGHGLPIENKVESALGIKSKKEIEQRVGVKPFIDECKKYLREISDQWEWYIDHIGRWVNFRDAYRTWDTPYMESVMWVFKQMYDRGYIYKGLRVSLYCPHCSTPISNFEVAMDASENYKEITEPANMYKYKLKEKFQIPNSKDQKELSTINYQLSTDLPTFFLAWSTTPWTKLTTTALAVNPELVYVTVEYQKERYILAESTLENVLKKKGLTSADVTVVEKCQGKDLAGIQYEGHYDFYKPEAGKQLHVIVADDFVTAGEGTGIVTLAAYGEDDLRVMKRDDIQIVLDIDDEGKLTANNPPAWMGAYYLKVNPLVNQDLTDRGLMFHEDPSHRHMIAHCWRCHTRLFHNPQVAWYVAVQKLKTKMRETNESVSWYPDHFKYGRFLKSMESAPDWCISRSRYWGSPVPVWECGCGELFVPGSIDELEKASGQSITDLHKPEIDEVTVTCIKCGQQARRVSEVLDSWIEAGSASFAERHFPFDGQLKVEDFFPPDFISEYTGQIRAWFYVLHVISAAIYDQPAFKNVLVTGVIMGSDGRKMSKNYKNYPDPREMIEKYGGDALRLYLLSTPLTKAEDINISETDYRDQLRKLIIPLLNIWNFYQMYSEVDHFQSERHGVRKEPLYTLHFENVLDKWLVSRLHSTVKKVTESLEVYDTMTTVTLITGFVDDWSKWQLRRSRDRVGSGELTEDAHDFYHTTEYVFEIFLRLIAPIVPFHSEYLYRQLTASDSVHLEHWPVVMKILIHPELESNTSIARQICEIGHQMRKTNGWKVRQPLARLEIQIDADCATIQPNLWQVILDELNIKNVVVNEIHRYPAQEVIVTEEDLAREGQLRDLVRQIQALRKEAKVGISDRIRLQAPVDVIPLINEIKKQARVSEVVEGEALTIL